MDIAVLLMLCLFLCLMATASLVVMLAFVGSGSVLQVECKDWKAGAFRVPARGFERSMSGARPSRFSAF